MDQFSSLVELKGIGNFPNFDEFSMGMWEHIKAKKCQICVQSNLSVMLLAKVENPKYNWF